MVTSAQAYWLAHLPQTVGIHFIGLDMLYDAREHAEVALQERIAPIIQGWAANGPNVVADVRRLQAMQQELGLVPPAPPQSTEGFAVWREKLEAGVNGLLADRADLATEARLAVMRVKWAFALGNAVGEAVFALNLGGMLHYLLDAETDNAYLRSRVNALGEEQAAVGARLKTIIERAEYLQAFRAEGLAHAQRVAELFALAPAIGSAAPKLAVPLQDAMRAISETDLASAL